MKNTFEFPVTPCQHLILEDFSNSIYKQKHHAFKAWCYVSLLTFVIEF